MKGQSLLALLSAVGLLALPVLVEPVQAQAPGTQVSAPLAGENQIRDFAIEEQGGTLYLRLSFAEALAALPASFTVSNPARIAFDFPATRNGLGRVQETINRGDLRSVNIVEAAGRTRLVLNMTRVAPYETSLDGKDLVVAIVPETAATASSASSSQAMQALASFSPSASGAALGKSVRDITFRRGQDGEGRVIVELSSPDAGINVMRQGSNLVIDFAKTVLPEHLQRRSDVTDFGTPVSHMVAQEHGDAARLTVTPNGLWEHSAYQTDTQFVLEIRRLVEDPNRLVQHGSRDQYGGEKLSLNFQNVDIRSVLQVIADFTDFNIVTSDSVQGDLTLRLNDVPWDQALDIILQSKGLDKRRSGNVIWIAPSGELAEREQQQLEMLAQRGDLEPLVTESFQINYHKAKEIHAFLSDSKQTVLSPRGSVVVDERSNKVFVTDVSTRLDALRRLVQEIDIPPRQVLIEARIVEANKNFTRDLGVRMGIGSRNPRGGIGTFDPETGQMHGGGLGTFREISGERFWIGGGGVGRDRPVADFSVLNLALFNSSATRFLNLELAALESDGRGRVMSSPRVLTANQKEASIEQGTEIPYQEASSSGATTVSFKKAVLSLKVTPQITPDGRVQLKILVNKDRPDWANALNDVPPILTKNIETEVLVENGGTVVIGGIYEEEESNSVDRVPLLGEIPVVGALFRNNQRVSNHSELLVFITPRIAADSLTLR